MSSAQVYSIYINLVTIDLLKSDNENTCSFGSEILEKCLFDVGNTFKALGNNVKLLASHNYTYLFVRSLKYGDN